MSEKSELSVRAAVMSCLARCVESDAPLCCLTDFLQRLRALDWSDAAIGQVESAVLAIMREGNVSAADAEAA